MKINCLICKRDDSIKFIDNYKFNVKSDVNYFGNIKIYGCDDCDFYFASPMPLDEKLNYFYRKIYRAPGRPHYIYSEDLNDSSIYSSKNLNYILYLSSFIDFSKVKNILDFGAGSGDLGYLIKKHFNHIQLHSFENDQFSQEILKKRSYINYNKINQINTKFDLIFSLHSLEHLTDLSIMEVFKNLTANNGNFFFEVPNCPFKKKFIERPYDSPHLLFFTKNSLEKISKSINFKLINLSYASYGLDESFFYMSQSKKNHENWKPSSVHKTRLYLKRTIKKFIPEIILNLKQNYNNYNLESKKNNFQNNFDEKWCIRGIFSNKEEI